MITSKFYSQISVCPVCNGWGTSKSPSVLSTLKCSECGGKGVAILQSQNTFTWNAPTFVDYKGRVRVIVTKILLIAMIIFLILFFIYAVKTVTTSILLK